MPTTIDAQNALQIRKPMDIYITLDAYDEDQRPTIAATTSYKIADFATVGNLYPLRELADLQTTGFPLDGSCVLYDSSVAASETNGKIGARGTVNTNLGIQLTSSVALEAVTLETVGVSAITYNGTRYDATSGSTMIPLGGATSATFTLAYRYSNGRAVLATVIAGFSLSFDNSTLISVELNLRSDLKPVDPTLPESEIEIRAYYPEDISQMLASVRDNKPITYIAGYDDDKSTARKFFLSEPATWNNSVVTIKGTDQIDLLDKETFPIALGSLAEGTRYGKFPTNTRGAFNKLYSAMVDQIWMGGIELVNYETPPANTDENPVNGRDQNSFIDRQSQRDMLANMMNMFHLDLSSNFAIGAFWPTYVDAGIPTMYWQKPAVEWDIYEEDCGSIQQQSDRKIASITFPTGTPQSLGYYQIPTDGGGDLFKGSGGPLTYGDLTTYQAWFIPNDVNISAGINQTEYDDYLDLPLDAQWGRVGGHPYLTTANNYGRAFYDSQIKDNRRLNIKISPFFLVSVSWTSAVSTLWNRLVNAGAISSTAESVQLSTVGRGFVVSNSTVKYSAPVLGIDVTASKTGWIGTMKATTNLGSSARTYDLVANGFKQVLARSNETGSFTWKGDPRMQPRDFFNFHRLDGTVEVCTIETISLKHEKGGTQAQITYRKGMV